MANKEIGIKQIFADGYMTALAQLEGFLLQTFSKRILNIDKPEDFMNASEEDRKKVFDEKIPLGSVLTTINRIREAVSNPTDKKADNKMDSGVILQ